MFAKNVLIMREGLLEKSILVHGPIPHVVEEAAIKQAAKECAERFDPAYDDLDLPYFEDYFRSGRTSLNSGNDEYTVMVMDFTQTIEAGQ